MATGRRPERSARPDRGKQSVYLREFAIEGIKCFERLDLSFPGSAGDYSGWVVILGGNGVGKSTLLQAIALALVGPVSGQRLLRRPEGWVRLPRKYGEFRATLIRGADDLSSPPGDPRKKTFSARFAVTGPDEVEFEGMSYSEPQLVHLGEAKERQRLMKAPYGARNDGWFSCGYGPFRRTAGASPEAKLLADVPSREYRFATLFREDAAIEHCELLLTSIYARSIDPESKRPEAMGRLLEALKGIVERQLPGGVRIKKISTERVTYQTVGGAEVELPALSDGYRSFLSLLLDVLLIVMAGGRNDPSMVEWEGDEPRVNAEGVVVIDEVDTHLHPNWQREIGFRLCRAFPRVQFIVASHSPFVAQAARAGGLVVLRPTGPGGSIEAQRPVESVKGWNAGQILTSPLFGLEATRDEETEGLIREHADLVARRTWGRLDQRERHRLADLEDRLSKRLTAPGESVEELERQEAMDRYIKRTLATLHDDD
jgi:energy-coupling factor transporter ATP-binding protein EcfA2